MRRRHRAADPVLLNQADIPRTKAARAAKARNSPAWVFARDAYEFYRANVHAQFGLRPYTVPPSYGRDLWQRLADACAAHSVSAARYVCWTLQPNDVPPRCPEPTNLLSGRLLSAYVAYQPKRQKELGWHGPYELRAYRAMLATCAGPAPGGRPAASIEDTRVRVLAAGSQVLSHVFRYVVARHYARRSRDGRLAEVEDGLRVSASLQFQADAPAYMKTWATDLGSLWPPEFTPDQSELWFADFLARRHRRGDECGEKGGPRE
jgi:hypothetical protein